MPDARVSIVRRLRRLMARFRQGVEETDPVAKLEKKFSQLDKRVDQLTRWQHDDRLLLRRIARILEERGGGQNEPATAPALRPPVAPSVPEDWQDVRACPICAHGGATLVCEYNRFLLADTAPDAAAKIYNYSLCHGCGIVYAARRPVGRRYRELLTGFHENLGRVGTPSVWLNPGTLTEADRGHLRRRAQRGALVSEHEGVSPGEWLPGAFGDRLLVAQHVELIGSLLTLQKPRVLEIRSRTGAILDALRRLYGASVYALPMFESQQEIVRGLYGIPADALIDFERLHIPYEGPFDLVVSNHMLTHSITPGDFLDRVWESLAPGGHLYLYNEMDEVEYLSDRKSMFQAMNPFHMQLLSPPSLVRALGARGFDVKFLAHSDRIHIVCLARKTTPAPAAMPEAERKRRLRQYAAARDVSILGLPDDRRGLFAGEWDAVVERAVVAGVATLDERGRIQFRDGRKKQDDAEPSGAGDV